jgi:subtilisin family serine protease
MNLSLGGGISQALDSAVEAAVQAGMVVAVAAGGSGVSEVLSPNTLIIHSFPPSTSILDAHVTLLLD